MGLLRSILLLPVKGPADGAIWIGKKVHEAVISEVDSPAAIRKELGRLENALIAGEIDDDAYDVAETDLLLRLQYSKGE